MKISIRALFLGFIASFLFGAMLSISFSFLHASYRDRALEYQSGLSYLSEAIRLTGLLLIAYLTARIAGEKEITHGSILGILLWISAITVRFFMVRRFDLESNVIDLDAGIGFFLTVGACTLGGFLRKKIVEKKEKESEDPLEQKIENLGNN